MEAGGPHHLLKSGPGKLKLDISTTSPPKNQMDSFESLGQLSSLLLHTESAAELRDKDSIPDTLFLATPL